MSRIGKIVTITILYEEYPQMWKHETLTGLVVSDDRDQIVLIQKGDTITLTKKQIMEVVEET